MSENSPHVMIFFSDDFRSRLRTLPKRYRSIRSDLQPFIDEIQSGHFIGDRFTNTGFTVFKVRIKNSDIQKGKSGNYRVIYQLKDNTCVLLIIIYSKSDQKDILPDHIRSIITSFNEAI